MAPPPPNPPHPGAGDDAHGAAFAAVNQGGDAQSMDFALFDYGPVKLGMSLTSASIMVRDPRTIARTGMDQFHVQFYRNHGYVLTIDGAEREVRPGDVGFLDLTRPATLRTDGIDNLSVIIERTLLLPLLSEPADFHGLVLSRDSEAGIGVREHLEEMWRLGAELTPPPCRSDATRIGAATSPCRL